MAMAPTGMVMPVAAGEHGRFDTVLMNFMVMGSTMNEPEVTRPREDHRQNRHQTNKSEVPALGDSVSGWSDFGPEWH